MYGSKRNLACCNGNGRFGIQFVNTACKGAALCTLARKM